MKAILCMNASYTLRRETHDTKEFLIVPVVMMVEGVHSGSHGAILHTQEELAKFPVAWNGRPVVIYHPEEDGMSVSANIPDVEFRERVGTIYNAMFEDGKLKGEAWLEVSKCHTKAPELLQMLEAGEAVDVSIGVFMEELPQQGVWNNETYHSVAYGYRPDHLAILPHAEGACNWFDGCGIRNNEYNKYNINTKKGKPMKKNFEPDKVTLVLNQDVDYKNLIRDVQNKLDRFDGAGRMYFLEALYDNHLIYRLVREGASDTYMKQNYTVTENNIQFIEEPMEVAQKVDYVPVQNEKVNKDKQIINSKKEDVMSKEKGCCEERVMELIAHKATKFNKDDKEWLMKQDEDTIEKLFPEEVSTNKQEDETTAKETTEKEPVVNEEKIKEIFANYEKPEEFIDAFMPEALKDQMKHGLQMYKAHRKKLIDEITANTEYKEEKLDGWETEDLEVLHKTVVPEDHENYSGLGDVHVNSENEMTDEMKTMLNVNDKKEE